MRLALLGLALVVADWSAEGAGRWLSASKEDVVVAGATYRVNWLPVEGGYDFRSYYNQPVGGMDTMIDKQNNRLAVMQVAQRLCGGTPTVTAETKDGDMYLTRVQCVY